MSPAVSRRLLAALLVAAQVLAPIAHALAGSTSGWSEVCTGDGVRRIATGDAPASPPHSGDHCPFCRTADALPGTALDLAALIRPLAVHAVLQAADPVRIPQVPDHDAQARAPPAPH